jgi:hypothetical protein
MNPPPKNYGAASDVDLQRLLRSAARAHDETPIEMPFGFDTRVVALSRRIGNGGVVAKLLRRVALAAAAVIVLAGAGAYFESRNSDASDAFGNEFAIADSAIQDEMAQ